MSPVSMCIEKLLFVILFCPMSEHKKDTNSLLSSLKDKKLQVCKKLSCRLQKKIQAKEGFFLGQGRLLSHQSYILLLFVQAFYLVNF